MKRKKLKKFLFVIVVLITSFLIYVEVVNRNSKDMTYRQKVLKAVYPAFMWYNKVTGKKSKVMSNNKPVSPPLSFYDLSAELNDGSRLKFDSVKGKKILIVNTASNCGYTNQYEDLEKLYEKYEGKLLIIGFPANDFKEQEKGTDEEIAKFCKLNYGVAFPLAKKSTVVKAAGQNEVFKWLTDAGRNGWNNQQPTWNFSKYLVDENGRLINYFDPAVSPMSDEVIKAIE
ncbi:MAG: glutathione peroxidase [Bacteroidota bacterium]|nr:glutathione peroxidase [Bacteroidota bacterium]